MTGNHLRRKARGRRVLLALVLFCGAYTGWWWWDSARCDRQDGYSIRGLCLMQLCDRAEAGEPTAQWAYGDYLQGDGREYEGLAWMLRAMHGARTGSELGNPLIGYCDRVPGFEGRTVESAMLRVAEKSPDAHLRLLQLYTDRRCSAFDLDKAAAQIPRLTQCAPLSLEQTLRVAQETGHPVDPATRQAMRANLALCAREVAGPTPVAHAVQESMPVRQRDLEALSRRLEALDR